MREVSVDLVAVDEPLDAGGRVGVAGDALEGQVVSGLGLRRTLDRHLVRGDCKSITLIMLSLCFPLETLGLGTDMSKKLEDRLRDPAL